MEHDSTNRFTSRVDNYIKHRPGYPPESIDYLERKCPLSPQSVIADVGAGTGIFAKLLLERNYTVYIVEPNSAMRNEADNQLGHFANYHSINGTAGATGLDKHCVNLVVCAQAFHWFNTPETKAEFKRILKPRGKVALIWNNRDIEADDFAMAYELLLKEQSGDYERVNHQNLAETDFVRFYKDGIYDLVKFHNQQVFNREQLAGRAFSSSYVPAQETPAGKEFCRHLNELFDCYQKGGKVKFKYSTEVYLGML